MTRKGRKKFFLKTRKVLANWALAVYCFLLLLPWSKRVIRFLSASSFSWEIFHFSFCFFTYMTLNKGVCTFSSSHNTEESWILCTFLSILGRPYPAHINCRTVLLQLLTTLSSLLPVAIHYKPCKKNNPTIPVCTPLRAERSNYDGNKLLAGYFLVSKN